MRKWINKRLRAIALGAAATCCCANAAFADLGTTAQIFKTFANGSYVSSAGGYYEFAGSVGASLGTDNLYMRRGQSLSGGEATSQIVNQTPGVGQVAPWSNGASFSSGSYAVPESSRSFWATPYYSTYSGRSGYNREITPKIESGSDYRMERVGFLGGVNSTAPSDLTGGWLIGYSKTGMSQSANITPTLQPGDVAGFEIDEYTGSAKMSLVDFQFGAQLKYRFSSGLYLVATAVGGAQDYSWKRRMYQSAILDANGATSKEELEGLYNATTTGNTLVANLKLVKNYDLGGFWSLTPSASAESSNSWIFKTSESGRYRDCYDEYVDPSAEEAWQPWKLTNALQYSRVTARVGADLSYNDENLGLQVGAYYGTQLWGDDAATVELIQASISDKEIKEKNLQSSKVKGDGFGRDYLECDAGVWTYANGARTARISGLYSIRMYSKATSQVLGATYSHNF